VVVNVGYNDWPAVYDVDRLMQALTRAGVRSVIWVTLREATSYAGVYAQSNARIRKAASRWKAASSSLTGTRTAAGKAWFREDGLHLTTAGALGLARLLRPLVLAAPRRRRRLACPQPVWATYGTSRSERPVSGWTTSRSLSTGCPPAGIT
jgi:hypothetical protein